MRVGIAIDVSTDVSRDFERAHEVHVLPSTLHLPDGDVVHDRDPERGLAFYRDRVPERFRTAETEPLSVPEIESLFLRRLVLDYDYVFVITLMATRSRTYDNTQKAALAILRSCQEIRRAHGIDGPFALHVVDGRSLFTGPAALAWEAARLVRERASPGDIRKRLYDLAPQTHSYLLPRDLWHARVRGAKRGEHAISLGAYLLSRALDLKVAIHSHASNTAPALRGRGFGPTVRRLFEAAAARVRAGLSVPVVSVSYGGDPAEIARLPGFDTLAAAAADAGVEVMTAMMSPAGAINVGSGALCLGFCAAEGLRFDGAAA